MEWAFVALFVWVVGRWLTRGTHQARSDDAIERERTGVDYRPDPLEHLDVKQSDRSIVSSAAPRMETRVGEASNRIPGESDFEFEITYRDRFGEYTTRRLAFVYVGYGPDPMIRAYCGLANAERTFRSSRIVSCKNLSTGRQISDLGAYLKRRFYS